jgi:hypothetical protein
MAGITVLIDSTAIVQECKQLHDHRIRAGLLSQAQSMPAHPGPVANTMNAMEIEGKPLRYLIDQANSVHNEFPSSIDATPKVHLRVNWSPQQNHPPL